MEKAKTENMLAWTGEGELPEGLEKLVEMELDKRRKLVWDKYHPSVAEDASTAVKEEKPKEGKLEEEKPKDDKHKEVTVTSGLREMQWEAMTKVYGELFEKPLSTIWKNLTFENLVYSFAVTTWAMVGVMVILAALSVIWIFAFPYLLFLQRPQIKKTKYMVLQMRRKWCQKQITSITENVVDRIMSLMKARASVQFTATVLCSAVLITLLDRSIQDHRPMLPVPKAAEPMVGSLASMVTRFVA